MIKKSKVNKLLQDLERTPLRVAIEPTNICNANCSFCAYKFFKGKKGVMDFETYKNILRQIKSIGSSELKFTPIVGDPLVDPGFIEKIRYAKSLSCFDVIYTYTNFIGLNKKQIDDLVTSGLTVLIISTCLQNREDFKRLYGVDKLDQVSNNIVALLKSNKKHGSPIDIHISLRHDKDFDLAKSSHYQKISKLTHHMGVFNGGYDNWCGLVKLKDLPKGRSFRKVGDKTLPCSQLYNGFIITPTGDVGMCWVRDIDLHLKVGNVHENTLNEILKGSELKILRENWLRGEIPLSCKNCLQYTSVLDHPLTHKYVLQHMSKYFGFSKYVVKAKLSQLRQNLKKVMNKLRK